MSSHDETLRKIERTYFKWLTDKVSDSEHEFISTQYQNIMLARCLHNVPFRYSISLDGNRESDAINMRYRFGKERGYSDSLIEQSIDYKPVSLFEVLVALAIRIEVEVTDNEYESLVSKWFWVMIDNLDLLEWYDDYELKQFDQKIDRFLDRKYTAYGSGSIFTFDKSYIKKHPDRDMRTSELWDQAMWYITEYYNG